MTQPSAAQILWQHIGSPRSEDCADLPAPEPCWVCAGPAVRGMRVGHGAREWGGSSYTGQNKVRSPASTHVCEACVHLHSRITPVPGRPAAEGKKFGGNWRNYSHLYDDGAPVPYQNASKGEKPLIRAFLRAPHAGTWFAAIADSGQKHVLPWAPINPGGSTGRVLFDETVIDLPRTPAGWGLVDDMTALLTAGATKDEITTGRYESGAWSRCAAAIQAFESAHAGERHGSFFTLAVWLAQRDEEAVAVRQAAEGEARAARKAAARPAAKKTTPARATAKTKKEKEAKTHGETERGAERATENGDGRVPLGGAASVPHGRSERAQTLGSDPVAPAVGGAPIVDRGRVDNGAAPGLANPRVGGQPQRGQFRLPGFD